VHSAPTVCHRRRLAGRSVPCSRSATFGPVHIQEPGVDPPFTAVTVLAMMRLGFEQSLGGESGDAELLALRSAFVPVL